MRMIHSIYSGVTEAYIWLGQAEDQSDLAIDLLEHLYGKSWDLKKLAEITKKQLANKQLAAHWAAITKLLERSYWRRCWIVQELVAAHPTCYTIMCGSRKINFAAAVTAVFATASLTFGREGLSLRTRILSFLRHPFSPEKRKNLEISDTMFPESIRSSSLKLCASAAALLSIVSFGFSSNTNDRSGGTSILGLLLYFRSHLASDTRDKVYSLLGIATQISIPLLEIDYAIPWQEVFRRTTVHIIRDSRTLNILISAGSTDLDLPSWVANWNDEDLDGEFSADWRPAISILTLPPAGGLCFSSKNYSTGGLQCDMDHVSFDGNLLTVRGILVSKVDSIIWGNVSDTICEENFEFIRRLKFLAADFQLDDDASPILLLYIFGELWCAMVSTSGRDKVDLWPCDEFAGFCGACFRGEASISETTPLQHGLLQRSLLRNRTLFKSSLPDRSLRKGESTKTRLETPLESSRELRTSVGKCWDQLPASQMVGFSRVRAEVGDQVAVILGCNVPLILRPVEGTENFRIVGAAFINSLMEGAAVGNLPEVDITLC